MGLYSVLTLAISQASSFDIQLSYDLNSLNIERYLYL